MGNERPKHIRLDDATDLYWERVDQPFVPTHLKLWLEPFTVLINCLDNAWDVWLSGAEFQLLPQRGKPTTSVEAASRAAFAAIDTYMNETRTRINAAKKLALPGDKK